MNKIMNIHVGSHCICTTWPSQFSTSTTESWACMVMDKLLSSLSVLKCRKISRNDSKIIYANNIYVLMNEFRCMQMKSQTKQTKSVEVQYQYNTKCYIII